MIVWIADMVRVYQIKKDMKLGLYGHMQDNVRFCQDTQCYINFKPFN